ncbi:hypothetical protein R2325_02450 [Mycobacteroides chelonae]|nr:hypothetical protein [Mycobacteroides chelonae]MEC4869512.1 hypothetical protein [Mycobacteroides chelonae]
MSALSRSARADIKDSGLTIAAYVRHHMGGDGGWHGDRCGCPDDRCIGFHHDSPYDCGCLPVCIDMVHEAIATA